MAMWVLNKEDFEVNVGESCYKIPAREGLGFSQQYVDLCRKQSDDLDTIRVEWLLAGDPWQPESDENKIVMHFVDMKCDQLEQTYIGP